MLIYILIIAYIILMVLGFKSTWSFAGNNVLSGSSGIVFPIILFLLMILIVGPIMGIINLGKLLIIKNKKSKIDPNK